MKKLYFVSYIFFVLILVNSSNLVNGGIQIASKTEVFDFSTLSETNTLKYKLIADEGIVTSEIIKADLPFTDVGVHWMAETPPKTKVLIKVRTSKDGKFWTKWKRVLVESYPDENPKGEFFGFLIGVDQKDRVHEYIQYRTKLIPNEKKDGPLLEKISFTFIDSGITPTNLTNDIINNAIQKDGYLDYFQSVQSSSIYSKPTVVSRNGWEADESLMTWTPEYEAVTHNIVHHTDTPNTDTDWKARIRSIYYYHAVTRGWGDIGYNYLIDPNGVIYEGRYGGDNVIGAHAYGYNDGSMGVAFLGSYGGGSYGGNTTPSNTMLTSAEHLLAWKCSQKNIDPLGSGSDNDGAVYSYISGHRDVGSTECPGDNLYNLLPTIRTNVKNLITTSSVQITITTNPIVQNITVDGSTYTPPQTFSWSAGSTHTISTPTPQYSSDGKTRYTFSSWSDGGSQLHTITVPSYSTSYTASFTTQYLLDTTVSPSGSGSISLNPSDTWYSSNQSVQLTASANSGHTFSYWSGDLSGSSNPASLSMNSPKSVTANFSQITTVQITITTSPTGLSITADGTSYTSPYTFSWSAGSTHDISTPTPQYSSDQKTRYNFSSWSDGGSQPHSITVPSSSTTYTASFTTQYLLDTSVSPSGSGSISLNPSGTWYNSNQSVQLTASANSGYTFANWSGDLSGSSNPASLSMTGPKSVTANFSKSQTTPTPSSTPTPSDTTAPANCSISINSGASYANSTTITLTLSATDTVGVTGYYLSTSSSTPSSSASGWTSVSSTTSYSGSVSYTLTSGDETKRVYVWYKDAAGNVSSTASDSIILDTTAPIVTITSPTSGDTYTTTSSTINLSGSASDGSSGVKEVTWSNDKGGSGNASGTTSWNISSVILSSGDNKITVSAKDNAGNASTDTITVTYSTPTPTPTTTPTTCTDSYEPNNSTSEAYGPLSSGSSYSGKICSDSDVDWFKVNITSAGTISLSLTVPSSNDYELDLYDASYAKIASSTNGSGVSESINYDATSTGNYYIKIYGFSGASNTTNSYTLTYTYTSKTSPTPTPTPTSGGHTAALSVSKSEVSLNDSVVVTVVDSDLNTSHSYADTGSVRIKSNSDTTGFSLRITETNVNSGTFKSTFMTADTTDSYASPPKIAVVADDTITVSYIDDLTAIGNRTTITNTVSVTGAVTPTPGVTPTPTAETGIIVGTVTDASGVPIPGATVSTDTGGYTGTTGPDGSYTMSDVEAGTYTLTASATDYDSSSQSVTVAADELTVADFALVSSGTGTPTPIEASVSIKPETINLKKKGKFKAYIELPSSYSVEDIYTDTVECNGAQAISARVDVWDRFIAKFNIQDLELNNYGSKKVQFTVSGELADGTRFEGSDMVKIKFK